MHLLTLVSFALGLTSTARAQQTNLTALADNFPPGKDSGKPFLQTQLAAGPYPVSIQTDRFFPNRTLYVPQDVPYLETVPIFAWENGMCYIHGRMHEAFLTEIASQGYLVIAPGNSADVQPGSTKWTWQRDSIDQALAWNEFGKAPFRIDTKSIGIGGHSCGGMESIHLASVDKRVTTSFIGNSATGSKDVPQSLLRNITGPMLWVHGGPTDIAVVAEKDYAYLKANNPTLPVFKGVIETGHLGTYWAPRGGIYAETLTKWLDWHLKGVRSAKAYFVGGSASPAAKRGWVVESNAIDRKYEYRWAEGMKEAGPQ